MSVFLESKKDKKEEELKQANNEDIEQQKLVYLYSMKKFEPGYINIYNTQKE